MEVGGGRVGRCARGGGRGDGCAGVVGGWRDGPSPPEVLNVKEANTRFQLYLGFQRGELDDK